MSYLRYVCLFAYICVQHILCCVFVLCVFVLFLVYPMLQVFLGCPFLQPLRYSLTFIKTKLYLGSLLLFGELKFEV